MKQQCTRYIMILPLIGIISLLLSCSKEHPFQTVDEQEGIATITASVQSGVMTRVGISTGDGESDYYYWKNNDQVIFYEVNSAGSSFTGKKAIYKLNPSSAGRYIGAFDFLQGNMIVKSQRYMVVHTNYAEGLTTPANGGTTLSFSPNPVSIQMGTAFTQVENNNLFIGLANVDTDGAVYVEFQPTMTQLEFQLTSTSNTSRVISKVEMKATTGMPFASKMVFGVDGNFQESNSTWSNSAGAVVLDNSAANFASKPTMRMLFRPKSGQGMASNLTVSSYSGSNNYTSTAFINNHSGELQIGGIYKIVTPLNCKLSYGGDVQLGTLIWQAYNCGYDEEYYPYGKLYQWGRNVKLDYKTYSGNNYSSTTVTAGNAHLYTSIFYAGRKNSNYDWCSTQNDNLWAAGGEYNPCPNGYRLPTSNEYTVLTSMQWSTLSSSNTPGGCSGFWVGNSADINAGPTTDDPKGCVFFPAAGYLGNNSTDAAAQFNREVLGCYWSSSPNGRYSYNISIASGNKLIYSTCRSNGYSVRCVKNAE